MNLVGLKELSELLDVSYDTLKVWKNRNRLPEPFQVISGTPVWDWDESEEDFRSIQKNENSGRPRKPKISIAGGLIEIDVKGNKKDKDDNVSIRVMGKSFVDIQTESAESNSKSKNVRPPQLEKSKVSIIPLKTHINCFHTPKKFQVEPLSLRRIHKVLPPSPWNMPSPIS